MSTHRSFRAFLLRTRRSAARLTALGMTAAAVPAALVITAPSADAAWKTVSRLHGARVELCKTHRSGDEYRIKMRLDNRAGKHTHVGGVSRVKDFRTVDSAGVRPAAGKVSKTKSIVWRTRWSKDGQWISAGIGETNGQGHGGEVGFNQIPNC